MPKLMDHVAYLSQEIGPRPAGTEEEQQAALYITESLQNEANLTAAIEDFNSPSNADLAPLICYAISLVLTIASFVVSVMIIPAIILTLIAAVLLVLEALGRPMLSKVFARGVSQNVVAKYEPKYSAESGTRQRKVILVSRYDSGKVRAELSRGFLTVLPIIQKATVIAMVILPVLLAIKAFFFLYDSGPASIVLIVLMAIALVFVALSLIICIMHMVSSYNEAANSNAAGTSVMLEVARRVGQNALRSSRLAEKATPPGVVVHGEDAALASGFAPDGAQIVYEAASVKPPVEAEPSPEFRLAAAKAAVAALTGRPVAGQLSPQDISAHLVQVKEVPVGEATEEALKEQREQTREAFSGVTIVNQPAEQANSKKPDDGPKPAVSLEVAETEGEEGSAIAGNVAVDQQVLDSYSAEDEKAVPSWFKKGQESAKKIGSASKVQRSRYASTLDAAMNESTTHFSQANQRVSAVTEERIRTMRNGINEIAAPQRVRLDRSGEMINEEMISDAPSIDEDVGQSEVSEQPPIPPKVEENYRFDNNAGSKRGDRAGTASMPPLDVSDLMATSNEASPEPLPEQPIREEVDTKRAIALPNISASMERIAPVEMHRQRAPLAEAEAGTSQTVAKNLLNMLPSIDADDIAAEKDIDDGTRGVTEVRTTPKSGLANLPSLSGAIRDTTASSIVSEPNTEDDASLPTERSRADLPSEVFPSPSQSGPIGSVSKTGSFVSAGATGAFAPIGDELIENVDPDDIYIDDADDSAFDGSVTETGAFAGPGYVDMPKSRAQRILGRFGFGKNKHEKETSAQEWLGVDDDFDARAVGKERGGWESFRQDEDEDSKEERTKKRKGRHSTDFDDFDSGFDDEDEWQGGAYKRGSAPTDDSGDDFENEIETIIPIGDGSDREFESDGRDERGSRQTQASENAWPQEGRMEEGYIPAEDEREAVYQFRGAGLSTEVWFVALGSELAGNSGMRAFLAEHDSEMRGAVVINIDALGAGALSLVESEGQYRSAKASSRLKRYVKKASDATGVRVATTSITWADSAATLALRKGYQAMSIIGADEKKPAFFGQGDDVIDHIEEDILSENADFIMELLKNI